MIHRHKNLHSSALNLSAPTLHINRNQANTQSQALGKSRGDAVYVRAFLDLPRDADALHAFPPTSAIGEVL